MNKNDFCRYLKENNCELLREGANHEVWRNTVNTHWSTVPRHREIKRNLCMKICKDLGIPSPFYNK